MRKRYSAIEKPQIVLKALKEEKMIAKGVAPSYYLEGLLYNVPDEKYKSTYQETFFECINWIQQAERSKFVCANEQYYLLWEDSPVTWRAASCDEFLAGAVELWNQW